MELDVKQVEAFFEKRSARDLCPVCAKNSWGVVGLNGKNIVSLPIRREGEKGTHDATAQLPVISLICENCGFVRLHALAAFEEALQPSTGDSNE